MTREEFEALTIWEDLQEAMIENSYYSDELDGDIYYSSYDLINCGLQSALSECRSIEDLRMMALDELDPNADIWVVSPDFTIVRNYWQDEFDSIKENFGEWLEGNGLFDDEEVEELEMFWEESPQTYVFPTATATATATSDDIDIPVFWAKAPQTDVLSTATAASDDMAQPDIPLQTLLFCL